MKRQKQMQKAFGINEFGLVDFPVKISNVQVSRIEYCKKECSFCFPHGWETSNSTRITNRQRTWKRFRKTRWRPSKKKGRIAPGITEQQFGRAKVVIVFTANGKVYRLGLTKALIMNAQWKVSQFIELI